MKKSLIITLVVIAIAAISCYSFFKDNYNSMVTMQEEVTSSWANVENQYQRRSDLIPNLVNTVKGYASHEQSTLEAVIEARSKATSVTIDASNLNEESMKGFSNAQGELSSALSRLLAVSEAYPNLKANDNFRDLQVQLEGTENRIATERRKFNEVSKSYNAFIKTFPRSIVAGMFNFESKPYFSAEAGAEKAPQVEF